MSRKQAVVLSGGGANGAYEVGVLKALLGGQSPATAHVPLEPDIFAGTSIGTFNATFLVSRWEKCGRAAVAELETVWRERLGRDSATGANGSYRFLANPLELFDPRRFAAAGARFAHVASGARHRGPHRTGRAADVGHLDRRHAPEPA